VKLTRAQIAVLRKLSVDSVCPTTTSTTGRYVSGTTATALVRRGLAKHITVDGEFWVGITNEGRQALRALAQETT